LTKTSDASHFIVWKRDDLLAPFVPEDVAKHYPMDQKDPDGQFASFRVCLSVIRISSRRRMRRRASPTCSIRNGWAGLSKAIPGFGGTIMTATYEMARDLGWEFFEKLAKQRVMQVQASADPPKKIGRGERAIMADGNDYVLTLVKESGGPVELVWR
jgi:iron(III) transport system substrate-binding protein